MVKFKRDDRVQSLAVMISAIKIQRKTVPLNQMMIFQKISFTKQLDEELKEFLKYKLALPLPHFDEGRMQKCVK